MKSVNPKGNQSWIFIGRIAAEAETPILWPPNSKNWLIGKDLDTRKDWRQEEKGMTENEMVGWHHQLDGHEFEQTPGDSEGWGSLVCCSPWGCIESDTTEWLNNNKVWNGKPVTYWLATGFESGNEIMDSTIFQPPKLRCFSCSRVGGKLSVIRSVSPGHTFPPPRKNLPAIPHLDKVSVRSTLQPLGQ